MKKKLVLGFLIPFLFAVLFSDLEFLLKWIFDKFGAAYQLTTTIGLFTGLFMDGLIIILKKISKMKIFQR